MPMDEARSIMLDVFMSSARACIRDLWHALMNFHQTFASGASWVIKG